MGRGRAEHSLFANVAGLDLFSCAWQSAGVGSVACQNLRKGAKLSGPNFLSVAATNAKFQAKLQQGMQSTDQGAEGFRIAAVLALSTVSPWGADGSKPCWQGFPSYAWRQHSYSQWRLGQAMSLPGWPAEPAQEAPTSTVQATTRFTVRGSVWRLQPVCWRLDRQCRRGDWACAVELLLLLAVMSEWCCSLQALGSEWAPRFPSNTSSC